MSGGAQEWAEDLRSYLAAQGFTAPQVAGLKPLTGGSSHDTWAFDLHYGEGPSRRTAPLILRRNFGHSSLDMPPEDEFRLLRWLREQAIPVAQPWLCATDTSPFGTPFLICERRPGTDLRKVLAREGRTMNRRAIGSDLVALQARIHELSLADGPLVPAAVAPRERLQSEVYRWTQALLDASSPAVHPLDHAAVAWLRTHLPAAERLCLIHGDFKANNILWGGEGAVTLLDWELAHIGDPLEDLAWTLLWLTEHDIVGGLLSPAEYIRAYEEVSGRAVERRRLFFWQLFALVKLSAVMLTGSGTACRQADLGPSHALLSRGVAALQTAMADYLLAAVREEQRP